MRILVTGGCGYVGTSLVERLLSKGHKVIVIDSIWFGNFLQKNKNLKIIKSDIRFFNQNILKRIDIVYHLANIANDPSVELNPNLSWDVNVLGTARLIELCVKFKVKKFVFASSGSVYGISYKKRVVEESQLLPISLYNKTKMIAEKVIKNYEKKIKIYIIRPATICGVSKRMRFDTVVNELTAQAFNGLIKVFGGKQIRPNLHINDMVNIYEFILIKNLKPGIYNASFENLSIIEIANKIKRITNCKIKIFKGKHDPRSYRQDSSKLIKAGYKFVFSVNDAIKDIFGRLRLKTLKVKQSNYTVKWMKKIGL